MKELIQSLCGKLDDWNIDPIILAKAIGIFLIFSGYLIHTVMPAKNFLFKDPITNKYGFKGHSEIKKKK